MGGPASGAKQGVHLKKGQKVSLGGYLPAGAMLTRLEVGLGWDVNPNSPIPYDLDASVFMLGGNNFVIGDDWFVFYGQPTSPDNAIRHSGDNSSGAGQGDDEIIHIDLNLLNPSVARLAFIVTINEATERGHNFSGVNNAYIRVSDANTRTELVRFNLTENYANVTSMVVGELYKHNNEWKFNPVGDGLNTDLVGLCGRYGVNVAD
ncbi:TerD family protein [Lachnospiraceae bacterium ZAX-1]